MLEILILLPFTAVTKNHNTEKIASRLIKIFL